MFEINKIDKTLEVILNSDEAIQELLSTYVPKMDLETLIKESKLTQEQANELSKEVKTSYWEANKEWILKKLGNKQRDNYTLWKYKVL